MSLNLLFTSRWGYGALLDWMWRWNTKQRYDGAGLPPPRAVLAGDRVLDHVVSKKGKKKQKPKKSKPKNERTETRKFEQ